MARLHEQLQYFVQLKITTDSCWQGLRIYLSGHNCPGEGEHKIMDFILKEVVLITTLTQDIVSMIMLGICSHEPHFALLREEVKFGHQKNRNAKHKTKVDEITFHLFHLSLLREYLSWEFHSLKEKLPFDYNLESVIDDWVLMGFLVGNDFIPHLPHVHIHEDALPLLYATYNEVLPQLDGYINEAGVLNLKRFEVFLKNFAKNDRKNFIEQMDDETYLSSKRTSNAWRNNTSRNEQQNCFRAAFYEIWISHSELQLRLECSDFPLFDILTVKLKREFYNLLDLSDVEETEVSEKSAHKGAFDSDGNASDECEKIVGPKTLTGTEALSHGYFGLDKDSDNDLPSTLFDGESYENDYDLSWTPVVNRAFKNHKRDYYNDKMNYNNISKKELREQAEGYIRAIQWNLHYYYHGCCSWSWFYPHHYAPYISDVSDFAEMEMNFDLNEPFKPFEQLLAVLPAASADCLPPAYRELMTDPKSPIIDFYPEQFETDLNGKKNDWEAVVLIPFLREDRLLQAVAFKDPLLTDEERQRNMHGSHLLFSYDPLSPHILKSTFPGTFPDIYECTARVEKIEMNRFRISRNQIVHGLLPGVKLDVVFPGFPTMKHIPHVAELHFADIRVFQQPSKKQSMILKIANRLELEKDMLEIASDLVGAEVHVNWPMLQKALVQELWTTDKKYSKTADEEIICNNLSEEEQNVYNSYVRITRKSEFERRGIDAGEQKGLALVRIAQGSRKCFEEQKLVIKRSYVDTDSAVPVSLSLVVQNVLEDWDSACSFEDAYPINAQVFISSAESKYYGFCGFIKENHLAEKGTLIVSCNIPKMADVSFHDIMANYDNYALKWYSVYEVARFLHTKKSFVATVDAVSRITGCVYVLPDESDSVSSRSTPLNKVNIGLGLKFTKRNQIVPDFTRRSLEGHFLYSSRALDMIRNYKKKYPGVFRYLEKLVNFEGHILIKQIFPDFEGKELNTKLEELKEFLHTIAPKDALETADGTFVDSTVLKELEKRIQIVMSENPSKQTCKRLSVKPRAIFMTELYKGDIIPDPKAQFCLLDRVICVKKLRTAPFGEFGTVIGLLNTGSGKKIDVLFDKPYFGGQIMRSGKASGARLPMSSLINITHGKRLRKEIPTVEYILSPETSVPRNEWEPKNHQTSCANDSWYGSDSEFGIGQQASIAGIHGTEVTQGKDTALLRGKWKPKIRSSRTFMNNSLGSEPQKTEPQGSEGEGKAFGNKSITNIVRHSEKMKDGANFGKVEDNNKVVRSGDFREISSYSGFNPHREYASPEGVFELQSKGQNSAFNNATFNRNADYGQIGLSDTSHVVSRQPGLQRSIGNWSTENTAFRDTEGMKSPRHHDKTWKSSKQSRFNVSRDEDYGQAGLSGSCNVISRQLGLQGSVGNRVIESMTFRDGEGMKSTKQQHGYSRTWFGCQSVKPKDYLPCSSKGDCKDQSSSKSTTGIQKPILFETKTNKITSPAPIALLKKNNSRDMKDVILSTASENTAKFGTEKQETATLLKSSAVDELLEHFSKQRLDTSRELNNMSGLSTACSSSKSFEC
uniref:5'-3' exoribonuclease 1 n=1 Tax=Elaeophora elaphi TaxID=1147741 RepID=A0A0R3S1D6_9BILA